MCGNFDIVLGPFLTHFLALCHPTNAVLHALRRVHAYRMLIGARCPIAFPIRFTSFPPFFPFFFFQDMPAPRTLIGAWREMIAIHQKQQVRCFGESEVCFG